MSDTDQATAAPESMTEELRAKALSTGTVVDDAPNIDLESLLNKPSSDYSQTPSMSPPDDSSISEEEQAITGGWLTGKKVTAMWCSSSPNNAFAAIQGIGWRKIANVNNCSFLCLTMLLSHAEATNSTCNIYIDSKNQIRQVYVW